MALIDNLIQDGWLKTPRIIEAFQKIKRIDFMFTRQSFAKQNLGGQKDMKNLAELNQALPIGYGQTISQPLVVAFMLEQLQPEPGDKILDVGSGSGWTSALLAYIVKERGKIIAIELIPELKNFGEKNVTKYNFIEKGIVEFICADGSKGCFEKAPFDRILCSAAIQKKVPLAWKEQLKVGGRIVTPISSSIWLLIKKSKEGFIEYEHPGFAFVPLVEK